MMVLIGCFHLQKEALVNRVQDMSQKVLNLGVSIRFGGQEFPKICRLPPRPGQRHGHKYSKHKIYISLIMVIC